MTGQYDLFDSVEEKTELKESYAYSVFKNIMRILDEISSNSSSKKKQEILMDVAHNLHDKNLVDDFKNILNLAYNPQIRFYIKPFDIGKSKFDNFIENQHDNMFDLLKKLSNREITGDAARLAYISFMSDNNIIDEEKELLNRVLDKDLKSGFSSTTINKIFPSLIPDTPYMRCSLVKHITDIDKWLDSKNGVISQEKMDGMFINLNVNDDKSIELVSRSGSVFPFDSGAFDEIYDLISNNFSSGYQYHGELLMINRDDGLILPRQISNGLFNSILKNALPANELFDKNKYQVSVQFWDKIPMELLSNDKSSLNKIYLDRLEDLKLDITKIQNSNIINLVETRFYPSIIEAEQHFKEMLIGGKEGTIVKLPDMLWKDGTSREQVKLKNEFQVELQIKEFLEGSGVNKDFFGSIRCVSSDGLLSVNVPVSGFNDKLKKEVSDNRDFYIDKILTVKANNILLNKDKEHSLFLPVFLEFREDKMEADSFTRIQEQFESSFDIQQQIQLLVDKGKNKKRKKTI